MSHNESNRLIEETFDWRKMKKDEVVAMFMPNIIDDREAD